MSQYLYRVQFPEEGRVDQYVVAQDAGEVAREVELNEGGLFNVSISGVECQLIIIEPEESDNTDED